jgi:hypothetical protein
VANLKALARFGVDLVDQDITNHCRRRAAAQPFDQFGYGSLFAREMSLYTSVGAVAHPAGNAKLIGLLLRPRAEEHALDPAANPDVAADAHGYSMVRSGASSAFIPTTLYPASTWWISPVTPAAKSDSK